MSQEAYEAVERAHREVILAERVCSWCDKRCESADHLYIHILMRHPKLNPR